MSDETFAERHARRQREYRARHPDRVRATKSASLKRNRAAGRARNRAWRQANPERSSAINRASYMKATYGITVDEYDEMLADQGGVCAICGEAPTTKRLAVDHDHETGELRGLLCVPCNAALGVLEDNLDAVSEYLGGDDGS